MMEVQARAEGFLLARGAAQLAQRCSGLAGLRWFMLTV